MVLTSNPLQLFGTMAVVVITYAIGLWQGYKHAVKEINQENKENLEYERAKSLDEGQKNGFEQGYKAGKEEAMGELKNGFIVLLKGDLRELKNQMPAPTKETRLGQ